MKLTIDILKQYPLGENGLKLYHHEEIYHIEKIDNSESPVCIHSDSCIGGWTDIKSMPKVILYPMDSIDEETLYQLSKICALVYGTNARAMSLVKTELRDFNYQKAEYFLHRATPSE